MTRTLILAACLLLPAAAQQPPGDLLRARDADGDGRLSRDEMPERLRPNFGRIDADGNGFVDAGELQAAAERLRRQRAGRPAPRAPEGVELRRDLDYVGGGNPRQMLDLLLPTRRATGKPLPLVVFIHGGAWHTGSKEAGIGMLAGLVESGDYAGATINYRLSAEAQWPAQIHDCKAAIRFLRGHAAEFGIDPARIAVAGSSAGGHLASIVGTSGGVKKLEGDLGAFDDRSSRVRCVVNFFGPQDLLTMIRQKSTIDRSGRDYPEALLLGGPVPERERLARQASPVHWVSSDDPPFLTAHGTEDPLVPFAQAEEIDAALRKAGVESHLIRMVGAGHGFQSDELDRRVCAFLDRHLRGREVAIPDDPIDD